MGLTEDDPMLLKAIEVFKEEGYTYDLKLGGGMMWVTTKSGSTYCFYPTTGRWAPYGKSMPNKHYRSKGARDFVDRFLKPEDEKKAFVAEQTPVQIQKLLPPEIKGCDLQEFIEYVYEMFEDGHTSKQVYYSICNDVRSKLRKTEGI